MDWGTLLNNVFKHPPITFCVSTRWTNGMAIDCLNYFKVTTDHVTPEQKSGKQKPPKSTDRSSSGEKGTKT